ncbi:MAG: C4-dicarboxylate TRAP transporter substrate-binding protein [Proteobacteria bacterium]|nr:C4-dicarboxylate TRAP transporter substrate-binding protein [Pseudomonadota bacterium]
MKRNRFWQGTINLAALISVICFVIFSGPVEAKPIVLKFGSWMPERHETSKQSRWWAEQITKRTGGKVELQFFYAGALGKGKDQLDNMKYGTFDVGPVLPAYDPAKSPLWTIPYIPWAIQDPLIRMKALQDVAQLPEMNAELAKWDTIFLFPYALGDIYYLWTSSKAVAKLEDLKGLKIRSVGEMAKSLSLVGSSPVSMPMPDVYDALSKGIIDGGCLATAPVLGYKLYEVCKYKSTIRLGMGGPIWVMKKSVFEKLPSDIQGIIREVSLEMSTHMADQEGQFLKKANETFEKAGVTVLEFPKEDQAKYEEMAVMPVIEKWIKDQEGKGLPGRKVWETLRDAASKYQ